ncbi:MAG: hypothetical protein DWH80_16135 [Planctomycetota bacterium]|nr:MAG: hypothetical protein DWH72_00010 [Planctomycetota bacterium]RLS29077.1 MAG: hypothetical protein DWH80_16135 [Planctomycetota bacterium]
MLCSSLSHHSNPKNQEHEDFVQRTSDNLLADQSQYVRRGKSGVFRSMAFENQNSALNTCCGLSPAIWRSVCDWPRHLSETMDVDQEQRVGR